VRVEIYPWLSQRIIPTQHTRLLLEEELPAGASLRPLLRQLADRYIGFAEAIYNTQNDELRDQVLITHNGRLLTSLTSLDLALQNGDTAGFIPVLAGS